MDLLKMDKTIRLLRNKVDSLSIRVHNLRAGSYTKEGIKDLARSYAIIRKIETNHYRSLNILVDEINRLHLANKKLIEEEKKRIMDEFNKYR
jgi:hypothetical protein